MTIKTVIQAIRTTLFYILFIGQTGLVAITIGTVSVIAGRTRFSSALARYWCASNIAMLRGLAGLRTEVEGAENIPEGGCIIAAKHQSDWDVFAIFPHTVRPAYVVKMELMRIPFFGAAARSLDCIAVDRQKGAKAIPQMMAQAHDAIDRDCRIVIFPEGTRKAALAPADYRQGVVRLYRELNVPVVPVALNSGLFWGRNSPIIWPGRAKARFLPPIPPGLAPDVFLARLRDAIEDNTDDLVLEALEQGLERPIDPALAERIQALKDRKSTTY